MNQEKLHYFFQNFDLAHSCQTKWENYDIGYSESCAIQIATHDFLNPHTHVCNIAKGLWKEKEIPFLLNANQARTIIEKKENGKIIINFDIVGAGWYLMSGEQERQVSTRDKYGRFTYEQSIQHKLKITTLPLVNYYFDILREAMEWSKGKNIETKRVFTGTITHDIDEVLSGWKHRIRISLEKKQYSKAVLDGLSHFFKPFFPWKNLRELAEFNATKKVNSTFFFLTKNNQVDSIKNADYSLSHPYLKKELDFLKKSKHEIGVHGSYRTHDNPEELVADRNKISPKAICNRFHFLQFDVNKTPKTLDSSNIVVDSTLGFQEYIGFRNSICTPFLLFDFDNNRSFNVLEVPLNIMDCTLEYDHYMGLTPEKALIEIIKLGQEIKKFNGNICVNWHNTYYSEYQKKEWKKMYEQLIDWLINEKCEFKTVRELL